MKLKKGVYDQVINKVLNQEITENINKIDVYKDPLDYTSSHKVLSTYLNYIFEKGLNYYKSSEKDLDKQIEITNKIIDTFSGLIEDSEFNDYKIDEDNVLKGIFDKEITRRDEKKLHPVTSLSKSSLFTGSTTEPTVYSELNKEIQSSDEIYLLVSFIKHSGLRLILDSLIEHTKTKKLRVITTSYMGASDYKAIKLLAELPNTEVRISYDTKRTRLHAKAYYFHRDTGFSTAYIGSSNMSKAALTEGTEWNMKLSEYTSKDIIEKYKITFETYWNSNEFREFNPDDINDTKMLKESLNSESNRRESSSILFDISPYGYQQEILDKLEVERIVYKSRRNLIVAATGERVIIVTGCINALRSRVSGTLVNMIHALLRVIKYNYCKQCMRSKDVLALQY